MIYLDASALITLLAGRQYASGLRQFLAGRPGTPMGDIHDRLRGDGSHAGPGRRLLLRELHHGQNDPNYYDLVLTSPNEQIRIADALSGLGLPPDSVRYDYQPLFRQPIFTEYASRCPNAEALTTNAFQVPVHPCLPKATVEWMAERLATIAIEGATS